MPKEIAWLASEFHNDELVAEEVVRLKSVSSLSAASSPESQVSIDLRL
jgi:hypothetical protein